MHTQKIRTNDSFVRFIKEQFTSSDRKVDRTCRQLGGTVRLGRPGDRAIDTRTFERYDDRHDNDMARDHG